ncbi:putative CorA family magnesium ion transporterr [Tieghemostelium lacteum]|uniref:Putative CorA family magnesium ion transporterr n=1 Tax=Tieghemostelium lacteum TaxID=361077 RepID=A0A151ZDS4_TIELA|nr:putative CorA family magnesium ion transporterr [Tieghemostelium lacteum]|eukprot:KYQ92091.1 putative CorA family magnesium ion transporterr [Tieghemostelium lacteum]
MTDKKILIVNEETDLQKEYSFSELMEFSKIIIDLKKTTNIKKNISSIDLFNFQTSNQGHHNPHTLANALGSSGHLVGLTSPQGADNMLPVVNRNIIGGKGSGNNLHGLGLISSTSSQGISSSGHLIGIDSSVGSYASDSPVSERRERKHSGLQSPLAVTSSISNNTTLNNSQQQTASRQSTFGNKSISSDKSYWIDLEGLNHDELLAICKLYSIHQLTYEDITSDESTEKCEEFQNYIFISTSEVCYSNGDLVQTHVYMILFSGLILTFHSRELDSFESMSRSFYQLDSKSLPSAEWIVASFFDSFNEIYGIHAEHLFNEVKVLEDFTLKDDIVHSEIYFRLGKAARKSTNLLSYIFIKNDMLSTLVRQNQHKETKIYLSNIKDKCIRIKQRLKLAEELLENINTLYISKVSLLLNEESHSLNMSMHKFSAITVIFMPLTFIAGIFGMNINVPGSIAGTDVPPAYEFFYGIMVVMAILGFGIYLYFKHLKWL